MFVVVFAHAIEVTPISMRQGGIILMEMSLYMAEKGFEINERFWKILVSNRKTYMSSTFCHLGLLLMQMD